MTRLENGEAIFELTDSDPVDHLHESAVQNVCIDEDLGKRDEWG